MRHADPKPLDRRLNAFRADLADKRLQGQVQSARFVSAEPARVAASVLPVYRAPDRAAMRETEAIFGEAVSVFERRDGWAWIQMQRDGYVGYVEAEGLVERSPSGCHPSHRVAVPATHVYRASNIKSEVVGALFLGSLLSGREDDHKTVFHAASAGGYIPACHVAASEQTSGDYVTIAEQFVGTPYLWGGCTHRGIDCSGLVQIAIHAAGAGRCPRDSDMQFSAFPTIQGLAETLADLVAGPASQHAAPVPGLQRGDLVFWTGHVGIATDAATLLHANAHHMATVIEPLVPAARRIAAQGSVCLGVARLPFDA